MLSPLPVTNHNSKTPFYCFSSQNKLLLFVINKSAAPEISLKMLTVSDGIQYSAILFLTFIVFLTHPISVGPLLLKYSSYCFHIHF